MEKGKKDTLLVRLEDNLHLDKKHPTVAIYGKTGSGKATIIKNSLYHMMNFSDPKHLRIAAITSLGSGLEGLNYDNDKNDIKSHNPFMYAPIANTKLDKKYAKSLIKSLAKEAKKRLNSFEDEGVPDIDDYNSVISAMPKIILICENLATLFDNDMSDPIIDNLRFISKSAAQTGIYLIIDNESPRLEDMLEYLKETMSETVILALADPNFSKLATPDLHIDFSKIDVPGEFYLTQKDSNMIEHGFSPELSKNDSFMLNVFFEVCYGKIDYLVSKEQIMAQQ